MKTYREIIEKFETAATYHDHIKSFGHGSLDKLNDVMNQPYTLCWVRPMASLGIQPYGQRTLTFEVYILDIPKLDRTTDIQTMSDCERILYDVYTFFRDGTDQQTYEVNLTGVTPVQEAFQDRVFGWLGTFDIITDSSGLSYCNIPN